MYLYLCLSRKKNPWTEWANCDINCPLPTVLSEHFHPWSLTPIHTLSQDSNDSLISMSLKYGYFKPWGIHTFQPHWWDISDVEYWNVFNVSCFIQKTLDIRIHTYMLQIINLSLVSQIYIRVQWLYRVVYFNPFFFIIIIISSSNRSSSINNNNCINYYHVGFLLLHYTIYIYTYIYSYKYVLLTNAGLYKLFIKLSPLLFSMYYHYYYLVIRNDLTQSTGVYVLSLQFTCCHVLQSTN